MSKLIFNNYSRYMRTTQDHKIFALCVFLRGDENLMNSIRMVEYVLHPTFPNPVREITDREHCFVLQTEAWGIFNMQINVYFEDGRREDVDYQVKLEQDDWPKGPKMTSFESGTQRQIYESLFDPKWQWRKISTIAKLADQTTENATRVLEDLSTKGFVRKAYYRSIDNKELWGATSVVGVLPVPR
jgi:transcription initiation factor IIF auxiliary subunit